MKGETPMRSNSELSSLEREYDRSKKRLLSLGPVLQGTILPRTIRREDPENPGRMKDYGPYYQWTRKREGKTAIQNLSASQSKAYGKAIEENRTLEKILGKMREISMRILELTTKGVAKRKGPKGQQNGLS
jgi:hypothetical protein